MKKKTNKIQITDQEVISIDDISNDLSSLSLGRLEECSKNSAKGTFPVPIDLDSKQTKLEIKSPEKKTINKFDNLKDIQRMGSITCEFKDSNTQLFSEK